MNKSGEDEEEYDAFEEAEQLEKAEKDKEAASRGQNKLRRYLGRALISSNRRARLIPCCPVLFRP